MLGFFELGGLKHDAYVLPGPNWVDWRLVAIEAGDVRWEPIISGYEAARQHDGVPRPRLYIVHPEDRAALDAFRQWYPRAIIQTHALADTDGAPWFVTVLVPAGTRAEA